MTGMTGAASGHSPGMTPRQSICRSSRTARAAGWGKDDASRVIEVYEGKDVAR
jgi:hypothetical protein